MINFLLAHAGREAVSFHMPGHKGASLYRQCGFGSLLDRLVECDVTEIPGADNLFQAEGLIAGLQRRYAALYGADGARLLVNGSSGGILAAILASAPRGGKLILARNCHKSAFNALVLGDLRPLYAYPELLPGYGVSGAIPPGEIEALLRAEAGAGAVILPSPNYYGFCSDIEAIAEIAHHYGKILIVDQAHGAHLKFFSRGGPLPLPKAAEDSGADIVINSIHKTLASFTQSAVLNYRGGRVEAAALDDGLQSVQSTSPSYLLMASLDANASILERGGPELMRRWQENLAHFYKEAAEIRGLSCFAPAPGFDHTKINVRVEGLSGRELAARLDQEHAILAELHTGDLVMCMTGIGNTRAHIDRLLEALRAIAAGGRRGRAGKDAPTPPPASPAGQGGEAPRGAGKAAIFPLPRRREWLPLEAAEGRVCAGSLIPYPPGVPLVCPGEKIGAGAISRVKDLRENGEKVIGVNAAGEVLVGAGEDLLPYGIQ
jgi:lysine decarboxylase